MRERPAAEARYLAREVPPEARIIGLLYDAPSTARDARAADAIAASLARRREHTLLASAERQTAWLDSLLGGANGKGLRAALGHGRPRACDPLRAGRPAVRLLALRRGRRG